MTTSFRLLQQLYGKTGDGMGNQVLLEKFAQLKTLQAQAKSTISPFQKAAIAEQAVAISIDVIGELVNREVSRHASTQRG